LTTINIRTKVINSDFNVYALFPGQGYKHRQVMIDRGLVFLDFPGLQLPKTQKGYLERDFTREVARSEDFASWISGGKIISKTPPTSLATYTDRARGPKRGKYINSLQGLHLNAQKGELIIVPTAGHYDDIMIGELIDDPNNPIYIAPNPSYNDHKVPARRVKWIGRKPQHHVKEEFLRSIRTSNPFVLVKKSDRRQIYDSAYPSYSIGDDVFSTFAVKGQTYSSMDDYFFQELINYSAALSEHVNSKEKKKMSSNVGEAIFSLTDQSYTADLAININSPGLINLFSTRSTPLIASALFALAAASCTPNGDIVKPNPDEIHITIGNSSDDPNAIEVQEAVKHSMESMGYEDWKTMVRKVKKLTEEPQISAPADVK